MTSVRKQHIDDGICSPISWGMMCVECRKVVKAAMETSCACNPETGAQCFFHVNLDEFILAQAMRDGGNKSKCDHNPRADCINCYDDPPENV